MSPDLADKLRRLARRRIRQTVLPRLAARPADGRVRPPAAR